MTASTVDLEISCSRAKALILCLTTSLLNYLPDVALASFQVACRVFVPSALACANPARVRSTNVSRAISTTAASTSLRAGRQA